MLPLLWSRDGDFCTSYSSWSLSLCVGSLENGSDFVYHLCLCQDYQLFPEQEEHRCDRKEKKEFKQAGFFGTVTYKGVTFSSLAVMGNNFFPGQY